MNAAISRRRAVLVGMAAVCVIPIMALQADPARAAVNAHVQAGVLIVNSDAAGDTISVALDPVLSTQINIDVGGNGTVDFAFDRATFTAIHVNGNGGNDDLVISRSGGDFNDEAVTLNGGPGNDTLIGGDGDDTLSGGNGNDLVAGSRGDDVALLGTGNDTFSWSPGDGSDVIEGQDGYDLIDFNESNVNEKCELSANGSRLRLTRDVATVTLDAAGVEEVAVHALGGADTLTVDNLAGTDVKTVDAELGLLGGGGDGAADVVNVEGTPRGDHVNVTNSGGALVVGGLAAVTRVTDGEAADSVHIQTGAGNDVLNQPVATTATVPIDFEAGADADTTRFNGGAGDDQMFVGGNGAAVSTFTPSSAMVDSSAVESVLLSGNNGNDTLTGQNGLAGLTAVTLSGGAGNDTVLGGDGDVVLGGPGDDFADGGRGSDQVLLGIGNDTFRWAPGDGDDVVEGQTGSDQILFDESNINEKFEISANGARLRLTRDVATVVTDAAGFESVAVSTLAGSDTVTVDDLSGTGVKTVSVNLAGIDGNGDGVSDSVVVNGTLGPDVVHVSAKGSEVAVDGLSPLILIRGSEPSLDLLRVQTLDGDDTVTVDPGVSALIATLVDLGPGG